MASMLCLINVVYPEYDPLGLPFVACIQAVKHPEEVGNNTVSNLDSNHRRRRVKTRSAKQIRRNGLDPIL